MKTCDKCKTTINKGEERNLQSIVLCEDCYIDSTVPDMRKTYYEHDNAEFFRRLNDTHSVRKQKYH